MQHQKLSSGECALHPVIHAFPGTVQSEYFWTTCLIEFSHRKAVGNVSMLEMRVNFAHMDLVMLNFSFEFHAVLCTFDK